MKVDRKLIGLLCLVLPVIWAPTVYAYGTATHFLISFYSYSDAHNIQANFFTALGLPNTINFSVPVVTQGQTQITAQSAQNWLGDGSMDEDNDPLPIVDPLTGINVSLSGARVLYHFYDPVAPLNSTLSLTGGLEFSGQSCTAHMSPSRDWAITGAGDGTAIWNIHGAGVVGVAQSVSSENQWPWIISSLSGTQQGAQFHFLQGLTSSAASDRLTEFGRMFQSLGHVIHLLQDAAQPQHVRNDWHLNPPSDGLVGPLLNYLCGSNVSAYETYVENKLFSNPNWFTGYAPPAGSQFESPQAFFVDVAAFTNTNFVSRGTNCTVPPTSCSIQFPCPCGSGTSATSFYSYSYALPAFSASAPGTPRLFVDQIYGGRFAQCLNDWTMTATNPGFSASDAADLCTTAAMTFYQNTVTDIYTGSTTQNLRMTSGSIFDLDLKTRSEAPVFTLNSFNYQAQADILVPVAEGYSAGLLNYFFRGSMTAGGNSNGFSITNNTMNGSASENMSGRFSLYYDDTSGNRDPLGGPDPQLPGPWTISIPGNGTALTDINGNPLSFTPPSDAATPGQYTLVFQGVLGLDGFGAVAGATVTIPSVISPPQTTGTPRKAIRR